MNWEQLTAPRFAQAVQTVGGVCVLPLGVVEKHGEHLPLGTDYLAGSRIAEKAAALEPAMVFPPYYLGQIHEARHQPGTIAIRYQLMFDLLENICEEIARNGLRKIVILNCHGGNTAFLNHFLFYTLEKQRDYVVYVLGLDEYYPEKAPAWQQMQQSTGGGHADECETSLMLAAFPELVRMEEIGGNGVPRRRVTHLQGLHTGLDWYADYPDHYAGDAVYSTRDKGDYLLDYAVKQVAKYIGIVKADSTTPALAREFYARAQQPVTPAPANDNGVRPESV